MNSKYRNSKPSDFGFTVVELLVVVVIIGILATITMVSYSGISQKATIASIQSDLSNNASKLKLYQVEYGSYPTALDVSNCPTVPTVDARYCIKTSNGATVDYFADTSSFGLTITKNTISYNITESTSSTVGVLVNPWLTIGTQKWARANLNVGTMITGATAQTNNAILEKYCYVDKESNCTIYGGLYQWSEAMQYVTTEGTQGICPAGSHVPSDNDWKILEMQLGMTQAQADVADWRGTDQSTQLETGGSSGLNMLLGGYRGADALFYNSSFFTDLWSSSQSDVGNAWGRGLYYTYSTVNRAIYGKSYGFSIRCLKN